MKNSESPPIRDLATTIYRLKAYRIQCIHSKICYLLNEEKSCTNLTKVVCQVVYKELILGVYQNQEKENLKRVAWRLDVGHKDRIRIKSLVFAFAFF